jgi:GH24 family phage-related lysozyme (muramidase)
MKYILGLLIWFNNSMIFEIKRDLTKDIMMEDYRNLLKPLLDEHEGFTDEVITDSNNNPTVGNGINLNDKNNHGILSIHGIDPTSLMNGGKISKEQGDAVRDTIINQKEKLIRDRIGNDLFDKLTNNEKASIASLGYNSLNLLGPKLREHLASGDKLMAAKEMLLNSNKDKSLGVLRRRTDEARTFLGDEEFSKLQQLLDDNEKSGLNEVINSSPNENVRKQYLEKYGNLIQRSNAPKPLDFTNLFDLKKPIQ